MEGELTNFFFFSCPDVMVVNCSKLLSLKSDFGTESCRKRILRALTTDLIKMIFNNEFFVVLCMYNSIKNQNGGFQ